MACDHCDHKGYLSEEYLKSSAEMKMLRMCPLCNDVLAYSKAVRAKYGGAKPKPVRGPKAPETGKKVLAFRRRDLV